MIHIQIKYLYEHINKNITIQNMRRLTFKQTEAVKLDVWLNQNECDDEKDIMWRWKRDDLKWEDIELEEEEMSVGYALVF